MSRNLRNAVVVVTGASSGIGYGTALEFARRGANVVLAARGEQPLYEAAAACERMGVRALAVPTDMTDERAVQELARRALSAFGRIDVWVNNHGVYMAGSFEQTPPDSYRQMMEVNFFGVVNGSRAVLPIFRRQRRGTLINIGSLLSTVAVPYFSAYVASKHAVRGLSGSLRQELYLDGLRDVHVCTVMPAVIDTPLFDHTANYTGRALKTMPPVYSPERVARTVADLAERPKDEVFVGNMARASWLQSLFAPSMTEHQMAQYVDTLHFDNERRVPTSQGNLFRSQQEAAAVRGGWQHPADPAIRRLAPLALAAIPAFLLWRRARGG